MGMIEELSAHVAAASTAITVGTNLFRRTLVTSTGTDQATMAFLEPPGSAPTRTYQSTAVVWENLRLQTIAQTTAPSSGATIPASSNARDLIYDAWRTLESISNSTIASVGYLRVEAVTSPFQLPGQTDDGRIQFSANFDVWRRST